MPIFTPSPTHPTPHHHESRSARAQRTAQNRRRLRQRRTLRRSLQADYTPGSQELEPDPQNIATTITAEEPTEADEALDTVRQALLQIHEKLHNLALPLPCEVCSERYTRMTFQQRKHISRRCATSKKKNN